VGGGIAFCALSLVASFLVARHLTSASWPLQQADVALVFLAGAAYLASFGFRALGWQRVFPRRQRPDCARCLAACGASAASGTVLPFRLDYLVKISMLHRLRGVTLGLDTIVLSIVTLGMVDAVAMLPLAIVAISMSGALFLGPLTVVILFCLCCTGILIAGPRLVHLPLMQRWKRTTTICRRVSESATVTRSTFVAGGFLFGCWTSRAFGSACLLMALGTGFSPTFALVVLCLSAAAAILPITAGGAVASMGATAGILFALGVSKDVAINFSLASALLLTVAALTAALAGVTGSLVLALRARRAVAAA
jgi:lysylphosphatidylglycerol synthase-like protein